MARKSIIILIVEGITDKITLENCVNEIFKDDTIEFFVVNGDMTTDFSINQSNIIAKVGDIVKALRSMYKFKLTDVKRIIQIVDTDGTYIPDAKIIEDELCTKPYYDSDCIKTCNVKQIINRNERKRFNLYKLITCYSIMNIPYYIFYMSCNLDHVFHNNANSSREEKDSNCYEISLKYENDINGFLQFIKSPDINVNLGYKESWDFITKGTNSLTRYSNIALFFESDYLR